MLLTTYLTDKHAGMDYLVEFAGDRIPNGPCLHSIRHFSFGEEYRVVMTAGKIWVVPDLETILGIVRDEFVAARIIPAVTVEALPVFTSDATIEICRELVVMSYFTMDNKKLEQRVASKIDRIRDAVTMYNLTQSWDFFKVGIL